MKKFLFTLAALLSLGFAAQASNTIDFPDEYKNMELTEAQLGTDIQVRMVAHFENTCNGWRVIVNVAELPEGLTLKSFSRGNGSWIDYINGDGDEETFKPSLSMLVHIVILNLTEIPVIGIQNCKKILRVAVIRKTNISDLT